MDVHELDYELPEELIAQHPAERRDESRLLVVDRHNDTKKADVFRNIPQYLRAGDCLVLNDTQVIRARLHGRKPTGGAVEIFLLREEEPGVWEALVRPSGRVKTGTTVTLPGDFTARVEEQTANGRRRVVFDRPDVLPALEAAGEIPLPPYIRRDKPDATDLRRYQTVYARKPGAVAAPTAGLHFTPELLDRLEQAGVRRTTLTLHVGYGTFQPIRSEKVEEHSVEAEDFVLTEDTAETLNAVRDAGGRIVAVGTTSTRVLETCVRDGRFVPQTGRTSHYIYPPYEFTGVDALLTNFHLPRSSLLALVCAFGGTQRILDAYRYAVAEQFRFYSYGDAMLIL